MAAEGTDLDLATRLEGSDGEYRATLSEDWEIWGPNGGYLATLALRAAGAEAEIKEPRSLHCHFLSSPRFADVELEVELLKRGRRAESFAVTMSQEKKPFLQALVKTAREGPGYELRRLEAPAVPGPDGLRTYEELRPASARPRFRFWENIERRPVDQGDEDPPQGPALREWARFRPAPCFEDPFLDAARSLILLDTYGFPAAYRQFRSWDYLAPNLDTAVWFHDSSPSSEWLLIDHEAQAASHGLIAVSGRLWDVGGRLLATGAAQLCCIPNPG